MSNALPSYMYKNPQDVLEWKQESAIKKSCIGCVHGFSIQFKTGVAHGCGKNKKYGRRCEHYSLSK